MQTLKIERGGERETASALRGSGYDMHIEPLGLCISPKHVVNVISHPFKHQKVPRFVKGERCAPCAGV